MFENSSNVCVIANHSRYVNIRLVVPCRGWPILSHFLRKGGGSRRKRESIRSPLLAEIGFPRTWLSLAWKQQRWPSSLALRWSG